jgi:hypothetical protein
MPDKPKRSKIPIAEGERLSKKYEAPIVIVFAIQDKGDTFSVMTYGASKALCRHAASLGNQITEKVLSGAIAPEEVEPVHLPVAPTNWDSQ